MAIRIGRLKDRVTLQRLTETLDEYGKPDKSWLTEAESWAGIEPISGRERIAGDQVIADLTHKVVMRYRAGVSPKMRLVNGTRVLEIASVIDQNNRHEQLELLCSERVGT
jgi:SPP1 family predicted phage head-tail adaptor